MNLYDKTFSTWKDVLESNFGLPGFLMLRSPESHLKSLVSSHLNGKTKKRHSYLGRFQSRVKSGKRLQLPQLN